MPDAPKPELERIKEESRYLRGSIKEELSNDESNFARDTTQILKFHGAYQQDDRDVRTARRKEGKPPLFSVMVRSKIPGGRMSAEQYLVHDQLSEQFSGAALRVTTRQGLQFHGVLKKNVKAVIHGINEKLGTTLGACGDNVRNVMACPAPSVDRVKLNVYEYAKAVSDQFLARTRAYHEIWLNGEPVKDFESAGSDVEPIYGKSYLPRKFKFALAFPEDNCVDVYTHDVGMIPDVDGSRLKGFNILVGGGLGMSHGAKDTFPRLADPFCFIVPDELADLTKAIVSVQRDYGDRTSRKHARMKYLIHDRGLEWFRAEVRKRYGKELPPPRAISWKGCDVHLGWHEQGDGRWYFGVSVENGRIRNEGSYRLKSGLREIVKRFQIPVHLTAAQDVLLCNLRTEQKKELEGLLKTYGIKEPGTLSNIQTYSMACPALPTCGLAITESERALPSLIDELEAALKNLGLEKETITTRMTGCPNGCARPYSSEIGLVGRKVGTYNIYLGGSFDGTRLNQVFAEDVPQKAVAGKLISVFKLFKERRKPGERFGDFCHRLGIQHVQTLVGM